MATVNIMSPKDGVISALQVADDTHVNAGDLVLSLDSTDEDLWISRLQSVASLRDAVAAQLDEPIVKLKRALAQASVDSFVQVQPLADNAITRFQNDNIVGRPVDSLVYAGALTTARNNSFQKLSAQLQQQQLEILISQAQAINKLVQSHLAIELRAANAKRDLTKVRAIAAGRVNISVTNGSVVSKGDTLFTINV